MAPNQVHLTDDNRSPLISITVWTSMAAAVLSVAAKLGTKWVITKRLEMDDHSMVFALVFTIGFNIAISIAANDGLGQHLHSLSENKLLGVQKAVYSADILYGVSVCLSKIPILYFLICLARKPTRSKTVWGTIIINIIWMTITIFVTAFQCNLPQPWAIYTNQCIDTRAFWNAYGTVDILVDLAIIALPVYLLYDLQMRLGKKISVITAFGIRSITIPLVIGRLVLLSKEDLSSDQAFASTNLVLITAIHANLSIIVACIPFFKPIMEAMSSGLYDGGLGTLAAIGVQHGADSMNMKNRSTSSTRPSVVANKSGLYSGARGGGINTVTSTIGRGERKNSTESKERMIIRQQTSIEISSENRAEF